MYIFSCRGRDWGLSCKPPMTVLTVAQLSLLVTVTQRYQLERLPSAGHTTLSTCVTNQFIDSAPFQPVTHRWKRMWHDSSRPDEVKTASIGWSRVHNAANLSDTSGHATLATCVTKQFTLIQSHHSLLELVFSPPRRFRFHYPLLRWPYPWYPQRQSARLKKVVNS